MPEPKLLCCASTVQTVALNQNTSGSPLSWQGHPPMPHHVRRKRVYFLGEEFHERENRGGQSEGFIRDLIES
jgi:hypothetical protein